VYQKIDATGFEQIYKVSSGGGVETGLTSDSYDHRKPRWSPDGNWLVYHKYDGTGFWQIYKVPSGGGIETAMTSGSHTHYRPKWSPDGNWLVYYGDDMTGFFQIYRVSSTGGTEVSMTRDSYDHFCPQWSPDGNWLVYQKEDATGYHQIYKILSGVGIEEAETFKNQTRIINVYPNPFTTMASIRCSGINEGDEVSLQVYDLSGRLIRTIATNNSSFGTDLSPGVYFLKVVDTEAGMSSGYELIKIVKLSS
jgi:Tol biopolymer transport system component